MWDGPQTLIGLPNYRLIFVRPDQSVAETRRITARDDFEALARANAEGGSNTVELWDGLRFIEQFQVSRAL